MVEVCYVIRPEAIEEAEIARLGYNWPIDTVFRRPRDVLARKTGLGSASKFGSEPEEHLPEAELLARTAAGDQRAFRVLISQHLSAILAIARRMLKDDAEAEDTAQETMLRLWRNAGGLELGPGGLRPWLRRVVSNLCIDRVRTGRNTSVVEEVPEQSQPASQLREVEKHDLEARVDRALKALPERQRLALVLFHYEGLSQIEVGQMLGVTDEAVESLLARARRALKASLVNEWRALLPDGGDENWG
jgi:RNA polymerase sigma-70 factor, ECF subfamily